MEELQDALQACRADVDAALAGTLTNVVPERLREAAAWYPEAGGKRLRPVMALLSCEAAGGTRHEALPVALAVELVHNFSLVHDDIMDRDDTRRGKPTVHRKWDESTAILAGDVLFARAFEVLAEIPSAAAHQDASRVLSTAIRRLCEGQAMDIAFERRTDVSVEEYLEMIRGKTALLFEASCRGGAVCARGAADADAAAALATYGESFGMAFQIADDLLDVTGDSTTLGKPWGSDIRAGKRTVLVLDALANATGEGRDDLVATLGKPDASDDEVRKAVTALESSGAIARGRALRDAYAKRADDALDRLKASPAVGHLRALNAWALTRSY